jgi:MFS family permease
MMEAEGAGASTYGMLESGANAVGLVSAVVVGRLSDRFGRKPVLIFAVSTLFLPIQY